MKIRITESQLLLLKEGKQVGLLYHSTNFQNLVKIVSDNKMIGQHFGPDDKENYGVSTTRNKNFIYDNNSIQIVLDGNKLSDRYKILPYDYWRRQYNVPDEPQTVDEDEEIILTPKQQINDIRNYIVNINVYTNKLNNNSLDTLLNIFNQFNIKYILK